VLILSWIQGMGCSCGIKIRAHYNQLGIKRQR
jgi:hypothetical protein